MQRILIAASLWLLACGEPAEEPETPDIEAASDPHETPEVSSPVVPAPLEGLEGLEAPPDDDEVIPEWTFSLTAKLLFPI